MVTALLILKEAFQNNLWAFFSIFLTLILVITLILTMHFYLPCVWYCSLLNIKIWMSQHFIFQSNGIEPQQQYWSLYSKD